jgi:hypothetical protein
VNLRNKKNCCEPCLGYSVWCLSTTTTVTNGTLAISFGSITQNPIINAIEILQQ